MNWFLFWMVIANAGGMLANLGIYAWGSHSPISLGVGIANGFVMLFLSQIMYSSQVNKVNTEKEEK